ncbi:phosphatase PAP2 family protein [Candidatus Saccharibacteria bacterium]|nr:phosphatase PAP2 family protein [Candidatus Saccharibacteria bacterium]
MVYDFIIRVFADGAVVPIVLIGAYALLFQVQKNKRFEIYCRVLMAGLTAYLIAKLVGSVYQPASERPFELVGEVAKASYLNNPGFPSDHSLFVWAITFVVWFETRARKLAVVLVTLSLLVCIGRVLALVHTPLDVIGGFIIALIGAGWYFVSPPAKKKPSAPESE